MDILTRYHDLISESGETYLWYSPDGTPSRAETSTSPDATPTDGWGSSAMLYALIEGLAGVEDLSRGFRDVRLSPRWPAAGVEEAEVTVGYECSDSAFGYSYHQAGGTMELEVMASESMVRFHLLLPEGAKVAYVMLGGQYAAFQTAKVQQSRYVDFIAKVLEGTSVQIQLR